MADLYEEDGDFRLVILGLSLLMVLIVLLLVNCIDLLVLSFRKVKKLKIFVVIHIILHVLFLCVAHGLILNLIVMIILYVRIDKKKKILVTTFLQALGVARDKIISLFYNFDTYYC